MATDRPDPGDFLEMAQRMLRQLFDDPRREDQPWADVTREAARRNPEPSAEEQRENLTFALATRAVEALEDLALNVAAIRQRLERTGAEAAQAAGAAEAAEAADRPAQEDDATGQ